MNIWLFTSYMIYEVKKILEKDIILFDYVKCGKYIKNMTVDNHIECNIKLATSNQHIYKISDCNGGVNESFFK